MRTFFLFSLMTPGALMAQAFGFQSTQVTTGVVGVAPGQTARLNVLYPTVPAPLLQIQCSATLAIFDDQRGILKSVEVPQLAAGTSVSLDVNGDTDLPSHARTQVHGISVAPNGCNLVVTLEIVDNATQKTVAVVRGEQTYPLVAAGRVAALR